MTLITLGPQGTFSHEMALKIDTDIILVSTITKVFAEVMKTNISGLVPLENSEAGGVTTTLDCLMQFPVFITLEAYLPIHHCLAGDTENNSISRIYAHPQSHEQCSKLIEEINVPIIHTESNAASALAMKKDPGSAAIISEKLAGRHKIPLISQKIENNVCNITRFIRISPKDTLVNEPEKCSLLIDPDENRSGLLYDLLTPFKNEGVNLTRIESRPSKKSMGRYVFFLDFQCESGWKEAVSNLQDLTTVKHLGCYQRWKDEVWI
jgi:prephenate dehydratase